MPAHLSHPRSRPRGGLALLGTGTGLLVTALDTSWLDAPGMAAAFAVFGVGWLAAWWLRPARQRELDRALELGVVEREWRA